MENHDPQIFRSSPLLPVSSSSSSYGDWDEPRDTVLSCRGLPWHLALAVGPSPRCVSRLVCLSLYPASSPFRSPGPGRLFSSEKWHDVRLLHRLCLEHPSVAHPCFLLILLPFHRSAALGQGFLELSPSPRIHPAQSIQQKLPQGCRHVKYRSAHPSSGPVFPRRITFSQPIQRFLLLVRCCLLLSLLVCCSA
ncbi:hypothetical protein LZ31DRAFT_321077 [Colletotrichum somersetense]|nr:hypothetical protein LZ31DRAFT_321077 [Colletotrichum somersetense]